MHDVPELNKCIKVSCISNENVILEVPEKAVSSWNKIKIIFAWLLKYKSIQMRKVRRNGNQIEDSTLQDKVLDEVDIEIIMMVKKNMLVRSNF